MSTKGDNPSINSTGASVTPAQPSSEGVLTKANREHIGQFEIGPNAKPATGTANVSKAAQVAEAPYRVALFWSSSRPGQMVRMLAEGDDIEQWAKRDDFICWVTNPPQTDAKSNTVPAVTEHSVVAQLTDIHRSLVKAYTAGALRNSAGCGIDASAYANAKQMMIDWDLPDYPCADDEVIMPRELAQRVYDRLCTAQIFDLSSELRKAMEATAAPGAGYAIPPELMTEIAFIQTHLNKTVEGTPPAKVTSTNPHQHRKYTLADAKGDARLCLMAVQRILAGGAAQGDKA